MRIVTASLLLLLVGATAHAGVIYGSLTLGDRPLADLALNITCPSTSAGEEPVDQSGRTDDRGSYSINIEEQGKCVLGIEYQGQQVKAPVYSHQQPSRQDFELVPDGDNWTLRRK